MPLLPVVLTRDRPQVEDFQILGERQHHPVDVGQLVARRVHEDAVGIALERPRGLVDGRHSFPRRDDRQLRVERPVALVEEHPDPAVELLVFDLLVELRLRGVLRMELLEVVRGGIPTQPERPSPGLPGEVRGAGQHVGQHEVRLGELELDRVGVDLLDLALLAVDRHRRRGRGHEVLVPIDVLEPEHEVIRGERLAVAPVHPPAQMQDERLAAILHLIGLGDVGGDPVARVVPEQQVVGARAAAIPVPEVGRPREAAAPRPAVLADLVQRLDDKRVLPDAVRHRRQLARLDHLRQLGGLTELLGELRRVGDDVWPFQLADQSALGSVRSESSCCDHAYERPHQEGDHESGPEHACLRPMPKVGHNASPFIMFAPTEVFVFRPGHSPAHRAPRGQTVSRRAAILPAFK